MFPSRWMPQRDGVEPPSPRFLQRWWSDVLGSVSSGADDDIHQATALARSMVARWGMSEDIGPVDLRDAEEQHYLEQGIRIAPHTEVARTKPAASHAREIATDKGEVMHREEMDRIETCAECQTEILAAQDRAFSFGTTGVLCSACAIRRGGRYDAQRDAWIVAPQYGDLEAEFS